MLTKTKTIQEKENDLDINHSFSIPENIKIKINEKGFHLYNWIGEQDVKQSIERDFLKLIINFGSFLSFFLTIPTIILLYLEIYSLIYGYLLFSLSIINLFLISYIIIIAIKRSNILRKNSQVLITDTSISINGKIRKLENNKIISNENLDDIGNLFEEQLFEQSYVYKTKKGFLKQVIKEIKNGYYKIGTINGKGKNYIQLIIIFGFLYSLYALSLGFIYLFGIFFIWVFGNILSVINKHLLLATGHEITTINNHFEKIDRYSDNLIEEKNKLSTLLQQAMKSNWQDGLLLKINSGIKEININAEKAIETNIKLKKEIKGSKYSEMFNFAIYNSWMKKQIYIPLKQISDLLEINLNKLKTHKQNIEKQISETTDMSLQGPLVASKTRTEMSIKDVEKYIKGINVYINKLK